MELKAGKTYRTRDASIYGRVVKGSLLVHILPYEDNVPCRKLYLCTVKAGEDIPFLDREAEGKDWSFQLTALEPAEIELNRTGISLEKVRRVFAEQAGVFLLDGDMFQEEIIEKYNMGMIKAEAYVYASASERISSIESCRNLIAENTGWEHGKTPVKDTKLPVKKDVLYQTAAFLCRREGYKLLPLGKLKEKYTRSMDVFQMASASGIPAREIWLGPGWHRKDFGSFMGRKKKDGLPVALFRKRSNYYMYEAKAGRITRVGDAQEREIEQTGIMFYRPFEKKTIGLKALVWFGIQETDLADWIAVFGLTVLGAFAALILPASYEYLADVLLAASDMKIIAEFAAMAMVCMAGHFCITLVKNMTVYRNLNKMQNAVMPALYDRLMHLPEEILRRYDAADLGQRAVRSARIFRDGFRGLLGAALSIVYGGIFGIRMLAYHWWIGMYVILCAAVFGLLAFVLCRNHIKEEREKQREEGKMNALMFQYLCGIQKVRTDGMEDRALYEYLKKYTKMCQKEMTQGRGEAWLDSFAKLYAGFTMLLLFLLYLPWMAEGSIGSFVGLFTVSELFVQNVCDAVISFWQADFIFPTYDRCRPILENYAESQGLYGSVGKLDGRVEVSNVSFSYGEGETQVLNNISVKAETGDYIGIVGGSGCGKSTLFQIMLGFEKPDKGVVFYDHRDLEHINKPELRKKLGVVLQEESLFTGSIYENIAVSAEKLTLEDAWKLLEEVQLKEEVEEMPMGLHTLVTESGSTISGGQKQRILLARALAHKPAVLFLDEATSALDNDTQGRIMKMLEKKRMTRIVIAHRVNTVKKCSRIFVMDQGRIAESGTYSELLRQKGIFYELAKRQLISV